MKNAVAPFALALPLCAALAVPATASQFWDFSLTWTASANLGGTLTGRTSTDGFGNFTFSDIDDLKWNGSAITPTNPNTAGLSFFNGSGGSLVPTGSDFSASFIAGQGFSFTSPPRTWNWNAGTSAFTGSGPGQGNSDLPLTFDAASSSITLVPTDINSVPEINGSGFAYIAFILGALGLWLYSGGAAGVTRPRKEGVAA